MFIKLLLSIVLMAVIVPVWGQTNPVADTSPRTQVLTSGEVEPINTNNHFGQEIAVSGNSRVMVVGAPLKDVGIGAAYVYVRGVHGGWGHTPTTILVSSDRGLNSYFGSAVAIDHSGDTIVIGAPFSYGTGQAYIFTRDGDRWTETILKTAHGAPRNGYAFGSKVAITADGRTVAVGAGAANYVVAPDMEDAEPGITFRRELHSQSSNRGARGLVEIFNRDGNAWRHEVFIGATNPGNGDRFAANETPFWVNQFGESGLDMVGNRSTAVLAVGAVGEDSTETGVIRDGRGNNDEVGGNGKGDSGAVYVYRRRNGEWDSDVIFYIKADNAGRADRFGHAVSLSADGMVLAVGAANEDSIQTGVHDVSSTDDDSNNRGAVYLYRYDTDANIWEQTNYIKASSGDTLARFSLVALSEDALWLAVGAYNEGRMSTGIHLGPDYNPTAADKTRNSGAVFIFARVEGSWEQIAVVKPQLTVKEHLNFGGAVDFGGAGSLAMGGRGLVEFMAVEDLLPPLTVDIVSKGIAGSTDTLFRSEMATVRVSADDVTEDIIVTIRASGGIMVSTETIVLSTSISTAEFTLTAVGAGDAEITLMTAKSGVAEAVMTVPPYRPETLFFSVLNPPIITAKTVMLAEGGSTTLAVGTNILPDEPLPITVMEDDPAGIIDDVGAPELLLSAEGTSAMLTIAATDNTEFNLRRVATLTLTAEGYATATVVVSVERDASARLVLDVADEIALFTSVPTTLTVNLQALGDYVGLTSPVLSFATSPTGIIEVPSSQSGLLNGDTTVVLRGLIAGSATLAITVSGANYVTTSSEVQVVVRDRPLRIEGLDVSVLRIVAGESTMRTLRVESMGQVLTESDGVQLSAVAGDNSVVMVAEATVSGVMISGASAGMSTVEVTASGFGYVTATTMLAVNVDALGLEVTPTEVTLAEGGDEESSALVTVRLNRALNAMEMETGATVMVTVDADSGLMVGTIGGDRLSGVKGDEAMIGEDGSVVLRVSVTDDLVYTGVRQEVVMLETIGVDGGAVSVALPVMITEDEAELSLELLDVSGTDEIGEIRVEEGGSGMFMVRVNRIDSNNGSLSLTITGGEEIEGLMISPRMIELSREPAVLSATITMEVAENDIVDEPVELELAAAGYAPQSLTVKIADNDVSVEFERAELKLVNEVGSSVLVMIELTTVLTTGVTVRIENPTPRLSLNGARGNEVEVMIASGSTAVSLELGVAEGDEVPATYVLELAGAETEAGDEVGLGANRRLAVTIDILRIEVMTTSVSLTEGGSTTLLIVGNIAPNALLPITVATDDSAGIIGLGDAPLSLAADGAGAMLMITATDNAKFNLRERIATVTLTAEGYATATVVVSVERDASVTLVMDVADEIALLIMESAELTVNLQASGDFVGLTSPTLIFAVEPTSIIEVPPSQEGLLNGDTTVELRGLSAGNATLTLTVSGANYVTTIAEVQVVVLNRPLQITGLDVLSLSLVEGESTMRTLRVESMGRMLTEVDDVEITAEAANNSIVTIADATLSGVTISGARAGMSTVEVMASGEGYVTATAVIEVNVEALMLEVTPTEVTLAEGTGEASSAIVTVQLNRALNAMEMETGATVMVTVGRRNGSSLIVGTVDGDRLSGVSGDEARIGNDGTAMLQVSVMDDAVYTGDRQVMVMLKAIGVDGGAVSAILSVMITEDEDELRLELLDADGTDEIEEIRVAEGGSGMFMVRVNRIDSNARSLLLTITGGEEIDGLTISPHTIGLSRGLVVSGVTITVEVAENNVVDESVELEVAVAGYTPQSLLVEIVDNDVSVEFERAELKLGDEVGSSVLVTIEMTTALATGVTVRIENPTSRLSLNGARGNEVAVMIESGSTAVSLEIGVAEGGEVPMTYVLEITGVETRSNETILTGANGRLAVTIDALQLEVMTTSVELAEGGSTTLLVVGNIAPDGALPITVTPDDPSGIIELDVAPLLLAADGAGAILTITATDNAEFNPSPRLATVTLTAEGYATATVVVSVEGDTSARLVLDVADEIALFTGVPTELAVNLQVLGDYGGLALPVVSFAASPTEIVEVPSSQSGVLNGDTLVQVRGLSEGSATLTLTVSGANYVTTAAEVQVTVRDRVLQITGLDVSALSLVAGESTMRSLRVESMGQMLTESDGVRLSAEVANSSVVTVVAATLSGVTISGAEAGMSTVEMTASGFGYVPATATLEVEVTTMKLTVDAEILTLREGTSAVLTVGVNRELNEDEVVTVTAVVSGGFGLLSVEPSTVILNEMTPNAEIEVEVRTQGGGQGQRARILSLTGTGVDGIEGAEVSVEIAAEEEVTLEFELDVETVEIVRGASTKLSLGLRGTDRLELGEGVTVTVTVDEDSVVEAEVSLEELMLRGLQEGMSRIELIASGEGYVTATTMLEVSVTEMRVTVDAVAVELEEGESTMLRVGLNRKLNEGETVTVTVVIEGGAGLLRVLPSTVILSETTPSAEIEVEVETQDRRQGLRTGTVTLSGEGSADELDVIVAAEVGVEIESELIGLGIALATTRLSLVVGESTMLGVTVRMAMDAIEGVVVMTTVIGTAGLDTDADMSELSVTGLSAGMSTVEVTASGEGYVPATATLMVNVEALMLEVTPTEVTLAEGVDEESNALVTVQLNRALNAMEMETGATVMVTVDADSGLMVGTTGGDRLSGVNSDEVRIGNDGTVMLQVSVTDDVVYTGDRQVTVMLETIGVDGGAVSVAVPVMITEDEAELSLELLDASGTDEIGEIRVEEGGSGMFMVRVNRIDTDDGTLRVTISGGEEIEGLTISPRTIELSSEPAVLSATIAVEVVENDIVDEPIELEVAAAGYSTQTLIVEIADNDVSVEFVRSELKLIDEVGSSVLVMIEMTTALATGVTVRIENPTSRLSLNGARGNEVAVMIASGSTAVSLELGVAEGGEVPATYVLELTGAETGTGSAIGLGANRRLVVTIDILRLEVMTTLVVLAEGGSTTLLIVGNIAPNTSLPITVTPDDPFGIIELGVAPLSLAADGTAAMLTITAVDNAEFNLRERIATVTLTAEGYAPATVVVSVEGDASARLVLSVADEIELFTGVPAELTVNVEVLGDYGGLASPDLSFATSPTGIIELPSLQEGLLNGDTTVELRGLSAGNATLTLTVSGANYVTTIAEVQVVVLDRVLQIAGLDVSALSLVSGESTMRTLRVESMGQMLTESDGVQLSAVAGDNSVVMVAEATLSGITISGLGAGMSTVEVTASGEGYVTATATLMVNVEALGLEVTPTEVTLAEGVDEESNALVTVKLNRALNAMEMETGATVKVTVDVDSGLMVGTADGDMLSGMNSDEARIGNDGTVMLQVSVTDDTVYTGDRQVTVMLETIGVDGGAVSVVLPVMIMEDEVRALRVEPTTLRLVSGGSEEAMVEVSVNLSTPSGTELSVTIETEPSDIIAVSDDAVIAAGTIAIRVTLTAPDAVSAETDVTVTFSATDADSNEYEVAELLVTVLPPVPKMDDTLRFRVKVFLEGAQ